MRRKSLVALLLLSLTALAVGPALAAADSHGTALERCLSCPDCADGGCDDEGQTPGSHEHCCQSNCWSHTAWLLPVGARVTTPICSERTTSAPPAAAPQQRTCSVFHPPRT